MNFRKRSNRGKKILVAVGLLLLMVGSSLSGTYLKSSTAWTCSGAVLCDPYTNFSSYMNYLQSFYQSTQPIPGFRAYPVSDPSGGDYCNYWMDDAGKMLTSFAYLNNPAYAQYSTNFIMQNAITQDGFTYLPERFVQGCNTYLHVNRTQLASPLYEITYNPVQNPSFELTNTSNNQPEYWMPSQLGTGVSQDINSISLCTDGSYCVSTKSAGGSGTASYVQTMGTNTAVVFAHYDPNIGVNGGQIGNFTASFLPTARQTSQSASSSNQMVFGYDSYPTLSHDTVVPANSAFSISAVVSASSSLSGVTFGVQVNEVCNNYHTESSPWGGEQTTTISVSSTPTTYTATVPTGSSAVTVPGGCAFHVIVYINPNTSQSYTFTIYWDSKTEESFAKVPWVPALADLNNAPSSLGISLNPFTAPGSSNGYYVAIVSSGGTIVESDGTVNTADIPNLQSPVESYTFTVGALNSWYNLNLNGASLVGTLNADSTIKYFEFGIDSSTTSNVTGVWDDAYYLLDLGKGNAPWPGSGQWMTAGYYYANNANMGVTNYSQIQTPRGDVYEKSMSVAIVTDTENRTNYNLENPQVQQAFGSSPYITDFFIWDDDTNASGLMGRQIFPYSQTTGAVPYRLYVSGGNGSAINLDLWIGVNTFHNLYAWINATMTAGQDYIEPTETLLNLGPAAIQVNDVNFGLGSLDTFMKYNPYWSWLRLSNGTTTYEAHGFNDTVVTNASSYYVFQAGQRGFGATTPTALLWTGFRTPEFADGFLLQPQSPSSVSEIDYVSNFFGHSLRIVNNLNGVVLTMGQQSTSFSFKFTTLAKTLWTEPNVLLDTFLNNVVGASNGIDMSYPGTWGFDSYALAYYGTLTNNQTILSFASKLWNSQYADASQRLHPAARPYNEGQQPEIYYRALFLMTLAGLILYPNNATTAIWGQNVATYAIQNQMTSNGLSFGLEEDGWATAVLAALTQNPYTTGSQAATYNSEISQIEGAIYTDTNFIPQTPSSWSLFSNSYLTNTPSVWNLNASAQPNAWCNHPQNVFRCGELAYATNNNRIVDPTYANQAQWNASRNLAAMSEFWMMSYPPGGNGLGIDARYGDNSGNGNTETDPVSLMGMLAWMQAMYNQTGAFVSNVQGAGLTRINPQLTPPLGSTQEDIAIYLSVPSGKTYNMSINIGGLNYKSGTLQVLENGVSSAFTLDTSNGANDIVLKGISSPMVEIEWNGNQAPNNTPNCGTNLPPTALGQLEHLCVFPSLLTLYGGVLGGGGFVTGTILLTGAVIYRKSESALLAMIIVDIAVGIAAFLIPGPIQEFLLIVMALTIAGTIYLVFKR